VADTPGIRALSLQGVDLDHLDQLYPEMRPYLNQCRYADCTHLHEPGCAIQEAVTEGHISPERYASYARLRRGEGDEGVRVPGSP
jgi:ribosome biogenesis GTPase